nr:hypothetical protein [Tanacetum cinerariifolium]
MLLYIKGKKNGKLLVDSVLNGPFQYGTIVEPETETTPGTVRARTYTDLTDEEKIRESVDITTKNIVLQGRPCRTMFFVVISTDSRIFSSSVRSFFIPCDVDIHDTSRPVDYSDGTLFRGVTKTRIVVKHRIGVDNTESGSNKMENWQLNQSDPDTFFLLNELHLHELHVSLDVHTSDQIQSVKNLTIHDNMGGSSGLNVKLRQHVNRKNLTEVVVV